MRASICLAPVRNPRRRAARCGQRKPQRSFKYRESARRRQPWTGHADRDGKKGPPCAPTSSIKAARGANSNCPV